MESICREVVMVDAVNNPVPYQNVPVDTQISQIDQRAAVLSKLEAKFINDPTKLAQLQSQGLTAEDAFAQLLIQNFPAFAGKQVPDVVQMIDNYINLNNAATALMNATSNLTTASNNLASYGGILTQDLNGLNLSTLSNDAYQFAQDNTSNSQYNNIIDLSHAIDALKGDYSHLGTVSLATVAQDVNVVNSALDNVDFTDSTLDTSSLSMSGGSNELQNAFNDNSSLVVDAENYHNDYYNSFLPAQKAYNDALKAFNGLGGQSALDAWVSTLSLNPDIAQLLAINWSQLA